jgi:hypothetical protein
VYQKTNKQEGKTIELYLVNRQVEELHVLEQALATLSPDSTAKNGKPSTITGQKLIAHVKDGAVDRVDVSGTATCVYHLYENGVYKGMNRSQGDDLTLFLFGNAIQRIIFDSKPGKSTGKFTPPGREGSEMRPAAQENEKREAVKKEKKAKSS